MEASNPLLDNLYKEYGYLKVQEELITNQIRIVGRRISEAISQSQTNKQASNSEK